jgi:hypothetical protein
VLLAAAAARAAAAGCHCCCSGWLPLLGLLGLAAAAGWCCCSGWCCWLPLCACAASVAACTSSTAASRLALAAPLAARAGAAGCRCCSGWCCWLPLLLGRARRPNFLATNFLATNFHSTGQLRLDRSADRSINRGNPRPLFFETTRPKSEKLDATNGGSKPGACSRRKLNPPPRRGARANPQRQFNRSLAVSMMQQTPRAPHEHTMRTSRRKIFNSIHSPPHVDKLPQPV